MQIYLIQMDTLNMAETNKTNCMGFKITDCKGEVLLPTAVTLSPSGMNILVSTIPEHVSTANKGTKQRRRSVRKAAVVVTAMSEEVIPKARDENNLVPDNTAREGDNVQDETNEETLTEETKVHKVNVLKKRRTAQERSASCKRGQRNGESECANKKKKCTKNSMMDMCSVM
ncbi:uncharacterized protein LOC106061556 isoform X1 [Biomphalaria glabrata]|uniref:Uncharacterized protein LOC106061556 isoform X1 n=2 Tax=Biomphalaria glabrata TaxID=6526 RepID=A0A9W3A833_BIOGL|nr:uncharacterized protein LOC106061556 isoform X1 [Biomphalaria glabrata]